MKLKLTAVVALLAVAGCTTVYEQPTTVVKKSTARGHLTYGHDAAASVMNWCDALGFRSPEAHRLCVMRGIDRLDPPAKHYDSCAYGSTCAGVPPGVHLEVIPPGTTTFRSIR